MNKIFRNLGMVAMSLALVMTVSCGGDKKAKADKPAPAKTEKPAAANTEEPPSREFIRNTVDEWGECRNVALTQTKGDMAFYDLNGYSQMDCPDDLVSVIEEYNAEGVYIDDVQMTENGSWLVLYGTNGLRWNNIPESLMSQLEKYNSNGEVINSVTFNDKGDWIVITDARYAASCEELADFLGEGENNHGELWAACVTDDALVAVYANGYKYQGNVPEGLLKALDETQVNVYRLKVAGNSWFFADKDGTNYDYDM